METRRRLDSDCDSPPMPLAHARARYLVVDREAPDGATPLPSGGHGKVVASFHTPDLAGALVAAEETVGRKLAIVDSQEGEEQEVEDAWPSQRSVPAKSGRRSPVTGRRLR
jgi:hypothetical protein